MRNPIPLPGDLPGRPFTLAEALALGVSRGRFRNRSLKSLGRGIRSPEIAELQVSHLARAYSLVTELSAASHHTGAWTWLLPRPFQPKELAMIHITRPAGSAQMRRPGVIAHRSLLLPGEVTVVDGMRVTTRARTWLDLAEMLSIDELVVIADHLVRIPRPYFEGRSEPYATKAELSAMIERHKGKRGVRKARAALELSRVGADSAPETELRLAVFRAGLPDPLVNEPINDGWATFVPSPDLSYREYKIAVEYEGGIHADPEKVDNDIRREERYRAAGWTQIRISKRHMKNGAREAVNKIREALIQAGWRP
ncbi:MAG: endonuclease domain-containing protein [Actinomycetota bacterium]|nr:endonuclease domain-containing protein [Actinomycetota bacterium]